MANKQNILMLYEECIKGYNAKNCGRDKCIELITYLEEMFPNIDFGNKETGFMNIENILMYKNKIN